MDAAEVLAKNKECKVSFNEYLWSRVSPEARDLATRMLAKNPEERISAKDALAHPWFMLERTNSSLLDTAQANIRKYCQENVFNMKRIKPEFSMITSSPLLISKYAALKDSPLLLPNGSRNRPLSPLLSGAKVVGLGENREEIKAQSTRGLYQIRDIRERSLPDPPATCRRFKTTVVRKITIPDTEDDAADFNEHDIAEKGTDCTRDTQYRPDGPCPPRMFLDSRVTMRRKTGTVAAPTPHADPKTPQPAKREVTKLGPESTENSAPTAGVYRADKNRGGFAESEDDTTFQTAIETLSSSAPVRVGGGGAVPHAAPSRPFEAPIKEEDDVFETALGGEEEGDVSARGIPTQAHQVPKVAPQTARGLGKHVAKQQCFIKIFPESIRRVMFPRPKSKKLGQ